MEDRPLAVGDRVRVRVTPGEVLTPKQAELVAAAHCTVTHVGSGLTERFVRVVTPFDDDLEVTVYRDQVTLIDPPA